MSRSDDRTHEYQGGFQGEPLGAQEAAPVHSAAGYDAGAPLQAEPARYASQEHVGVAEPGFQPAAPLAGHAPAQPQTYAGYEQPQPVTQPGTYQEPQATPGAYPAGQPVQYAGEPRAPDQYAPAFDRYAAPGEPGGPPQYAAQYTQAAPAQHYEAAPYVEAGGAGHNAAYGANPVPQAQPPHGYVTHAPGQVLGQAAYEPVTQPVHPAAMPAGGYETAPASSVDFDQPYDLDQPHGHTAAAGAAAIGQTYQQPTYAAVEAQGGAFAHDPSGHDGYGTDFNAGQPADPFGIQTGAGEPTFANAQHTDPDADLYPEDFPDTAAQAAAVAGGRASRRGLIVIGALLLAVGVGGSLGFAYKYSGTGTQVAGSVPTLRADNRPVKITPQNAGGRTFDNQGKTVYERLNGNRAGDTSQARLATGGSLKLRDSRSGDAGTPAVSGTTSRLAVNRAGVPGVRRVTTVPVNPDGTFIAPESADGGGIPGISIGVFNSGQGAVTRPKVRRLANAGQQAVRTQTLTIPATGVPAAPARVRGPKTITVPAPQAAKPAKRVASIDRKLPAARSGLGAGGYVVQVSARKSHLDALAAYADLQQRFNKTLAGKQPDIQTVKLSSGTWYRVRIGPPGSKSAAYNLCNKLKKSGLRDCLVKTF